MRLREQADIIDRPPRRSSSVILAVGFVSWNRALNSAMACHLGRRWATAQSFFPALPSKIARRRRGYLRSIQRMAGGNDRRATGRPLCCGRDAHDAHPDDAGGPKAVLSIATDITEKKKLEDQFLGAATAGYPPHLADIAHDLNNVLAPILMGAPMLSARAKGRAMSSCSPTGQSQARWLKLGCAKYLSFAHGIGRATLAPRSGQHLLRDIRESSKNVSQNPLRSRTTSQTTSAIPANPRKSPGPALSLCVKCRDGHANGASSASSRSSVLDEEALGAGWRASRAPGPCSA